MRILPLLISISVAAPQLALASAHNPGDCAPWLQWLVKTANQGALDAQYIATPTYVTDRSLGVMRPVTFEEARLMYELFKLDLEEWYQTLANEFPAEFASASRLRITLRVFGPELKSKPQMNAQVYAQRDGQISAVQLPLAELKVRPLGRFGQRLVNLLLNRSRRASGLGLGDLSSPREAELVVDRGLKAEDSWRLLELRGSGRTLSESLLREHVIHFSQARQISSLAELILLEVTDQLREVRELYHSAGQSIDRFDNHDHNRRTADYDRRMFHAFRDLTAKIEQITSLEHEARLLRKLIGPVSEMKSDPNH